MDTGSYMANQMDDLISNSQLQYEKFCEELEKDISAFITKNGYDWTAEEIFKQYREKYSKGYYVSYTCKIVIDEFKERLNKIYRTSI